MDHEREEIDVLLFGAFAKTFKPLSELRVEKLREANQQLFGQEITFVRTDKGQGLGSRGFRVWGLGDSGFKGCPS